MCRGISSATLRNRADKLQGEDRNILSFDLAQEPIRPGITGPASLKYRDEEELLASVEAPIRYNDEVIYPDKVRLNRRTNRWSSESRGKTCFGYAESRQRKRNLSKTRAKLA